MDSITTFPFAFRTAITVASLCRSMPIYLMSRLMSVASLGGSSFVPTSIFPPRLNCHEYKSLAPGDTPCNADTHGLLRHTRPEPSKTQRIEPQHDNTLLAKACRDLHSMSAMDNSSEPPRKLQPFSFDIVTRYNKKSILRSCVCNFRNVRRIATGQWLRRMASADAKACALD